VKRGCARADSEGDQITHRHKRKKKLLKANFLKKKDNEEESRSWGEDTFFSPKRCVRFPNGSFPRK
jgi:hypothetical protein